VWHGVFKNAYDDNGGRLLVGYIQLKRFGDLLLYSTILGHGDFLGRGIMPALHLEILRSLDKTTAKWLMYAGWNDGGKGLQLWKRKAGFDPVLFMTG
jgi:hypothetical protein